MNNKDKKYSINDIIQILLKNIILIIVLAVIGGGVLGIYAKHKQHTTYTASRNILISHNLHSKRVASQVNGDLAMIPTYADLIEERPVINKAYSLLTKKEKAKISNNDLSSSIKTETHPQSLVVNIKATSGNRNSAIIMANKTADAAKKELPKILSGLGKVYVYPKANNKNVVSETHSSVKKYTILGAALGALIGMVVAFVITSWKHLK